jgi:hypothetical protein
MGGLFHAKLEPGNRSKFSKVMKVMKLLDSGISRWYCPIALLLFDSFEFLRCPAL